MKKEIYFPKGAKSINFDLEKGIATAIYEEEKPVLKVGEWRSFHHGHGKISRHLYLGDNTGVGFDANGNWLPFVAMNDASIYVDADMEEVERLLISEAENRGYKGCKMSNSKGLKVELDNGAYGFYRCNLTDNSLTHSCFVFEWETGKWAEIVKKKPLYMNAYGTEFLGDDHGWQVVKESLSIEKLNKSVHILNDLNIVLSEDDHCSEILKDREQCLLWIKDNIHRLR